MKKRSTSKTSKTSRTAKIAKKSSHLSKKEMRYISGGRRLSADSNVVAFKDLSDAWDTSIS